ncbi:MAG TPA: carboxypeptidase-like regulatory domain-containing protein, partial [Bryobacteraceae bacterium]
KVTIATDMGRQTVTTRDSFEFLALSPGPYEVYAEAPAKDDPTVKLQGAYVSSTLRADTGGLSLSLSVNSNASLEVRGAPVRGREAAQMQLQARRKDLAGVGETVTLKLVNGRAQLPPGGWEVRLLPPAGYYVAEFSGSRMSRGNRDRADGWNAIQVSAYGGFARFTLSSGGGSLTGGVKDGTSFALGAPVYLEAWDADSRQRVSELRTTRTDGQGAFSFKDVPPGAYRLLATFEYRNPDSAAFDVANAPSVLMDPHGDLQREMTLYVIR